MSRYDVLRDHLAGQGGETVTMSLGEIDALVKLPASARRYAFWWANEDPRTTLHVQSRAWQEAGFLAEPNLRGKRVTFRRAPEGNGGQNRK